MQLFPIFGHASCHETALIACLGEHILIGSSILPDQFSDFQQ